MDGRAVIAVVAAAAVAVAGCAGSAGERSTAPRAPGPSPSASASATAAGAPDAEARTRRVVRHGRLVAYAVNDRGALLTVWQSCESWDDESTCRTAWQVQDRGGNRAGLVHGRPAAAAAVGASFVLTSWNHGGVVLSGSGRSRLLQEVAAGSVSAGDTLTRLGKDLVVVDPVAATYWPLPVVDGADGWVAGTLSADGTVWALPSLRAPPAAVRISWLEPGASPTWRHHTFSTSFADGPAPGPFAVAGDHVVALSMHDGVDVATFGRFAVSTDRGRSWSDLRPSDLPFDNVDALAATSGGTLYVASMDDTGEDRVLRSTDATWKHFAEVPDARGAYGLVAAGQRVVARRGTPHRPQLIALDDEGHVVPMAVAR
jgi:hypothetical protein